MSARSSAIRTGLGRGWTEFGLSIRSPQDWGFYLFVGVLTLGYLWVNRSEQIDVAGATVLLPSFVMPGILGALIAFGLVIGPASSLVMEREDGTLLRAKAVPHGIAGYVAGQVLLHSLSLVPTFAVILVPGMLVFDGLMHDGTGGWITVGWVTVLGLLATLPLGIILGSLLPNVQKMATWGMLPVLVLTGISGIFAPIQNLWGWVQVVAQAFPMYWLGLGMRSAFLPESAAALEIGGSWRPAATVLVLTIWAIGGLIAAPAVLRRMARRQSGSQMEAARHEAAQWLR